MKIIIFFAIFASLMFAQGLDVVATLRSDASLSSVYWFGWDMASGDFNGDGFNDVAVSSARADKYNTSTSTTIRSTGRVDIFFGPIASGTNYPDMTLWGLGENDQFGISVANAGDFNGDGFDDLIVGANVVGNIGAAYVFFCGVLLDTIPDVIFIGEALVDNFGYSCTGIGDQNRDGFDDVLVGALYNDALGSRTGKCYVYFGGVMPDATPDFTITGLDSLHDFGTHCDGPLDFNGDGMPDFVVGAVQAGGYWFLPGAGYVFYGGSLLDDMPDRIVTGTHPMEFFGNAVSALGDMNRDGFDEAVFAGYNHSEPGDSGVGRVVLLFGGGTDSVVVIGDRPYQHLGFEIASAGDIDMDGRCELAVAMNYAPTGDSAGFVKIYGWDHALRVDTTCYNPAPRLNSWFGSKICALGDITGDGIPNLAISDPKDTIFTGTSTVNEGCVYIYAGWQSLHPIEAEIIYPPRDTALGWNYWISCPRISIKWRLRHPARLTDIFAKIVSSLGEFTTASPQLFMENDSTLVFVPPMNWREGENRIDLVDVHRITTGEFVHDTIHLIIYIDTGPPIITPIDTSLLTSDPDPLFAWCLHDISSGLNRTNIWAFFDGESVLVEPRGTSDTSENFIFTMPSDFGITLDWGDFARICLKNTRDNARICPPNKIDSVCITKRFIRQWSNDLVFSSVGLAPTTLTIGAQPGASDRYNGGMDIIMPPIPATKVNAFLLLDDPSNPHIFSLLRDMRSAMDDTLIWTVITGGSGSASISWNPDRFPAGVFLLNGKLDMRAYGNWTFSLGETLQIIFKIYRKNIIELPLSAGWNLRSSPVYPEKYFMDCIVPAGSFHFAFDAESREYYVPERYPTGKGIWIYSFHSDILRVSGWRIDTLWAQVRPGWNLIGAPWTDISTAGFWTIPTGILIGNFFEWTGSDYSSSSALSMGCGYWALCTSIGEFFSSRTSSSLAKKSNITKHNFSAYPPPPPSLTSIDSPSPLPKKNHITVFPNPFNSTCAIESNRPISIYNITGKLVSRLEPKSGKIIWDCIDRNGEILPSGIYLFTPDEGEPVRGILLR